MAEVSKINLDVAVFVRVLGASSDWGYKNGNNEALRCTSLIEPLTR